jgi:hypothetical protein
LIISFSVYLSVSVLVNGNFRLRYRYWPTFRPKPIPKCRFRHFSELSVSAEISARVGTEILAEIYKFFYKNKQKTREDLNKDIYKKEKIFISDFKKRKTSCKMFYLLPIYWYFNFKKFKVDNKQVIFIR